MLHSQYPKKNSNQPNNTAPDSIKSVAPLLLGAVMDITKHVLPVRILAVWPFSVTQTLDHVQYFANELSRGSSRTLWRQTINLYTCSERHSFYFRHMRFHPIKFCGEVYWLDVSNFGADANSRNESKCASNLTQLGFQDGEGIRPLVNQLVPRFPKPRNGGADGGSLIVCLSLFVK